VEDNLLSALSNLNDSVYNEMLDRDGNLTMFPSPNEFLCSPNDDPLFVSRSPSENGCNSPIASCQPRRIKRPVRHIEYPTTPGSSKRPRRYHQLNSKPDQAADSSRSRSISISSDESIDPPSNNPPVSPPQERIADVPFPLILPERQVNKNRGFRDVIANHDTHASARNRLIRLSGRFERPIEYTQTQDSGNNPQSNMQSSQETGGSQSRSASISSGRSLETDSVGISPPHRSQYIREALASKFGENTDYNLKDDEIKAVIQMGDLFLRDDLVDFVSSFLHSYNSSLWDTSVSYAAPPAASVVEIVLKSLNCVEILSQRCKIDPLRLRQAQVLLHCYYEQLLKDPHVASGRSRGRDSSSTAMDALQKACSKKENQPDTLGARRFRNRLNRHKNIGTKWNLLVKCLGPGFLLVCSSNLVAQM
jgi:hypothetical protein